MGNSSEKSFVTDPRTVEADLVIHNGVIVKNRFGEAGQVSVPHGWEDGTYFLRLIPESTKEVIR